MIDPHGGQQDLRDKVLRHVTDAFRENPPTAPEEFVTMREPVKAGLGLPTTVVQTA